MKRRPPNRCFGVAKRYPILDSPFAGYAKHGTAAPTLIRLARSKPAAEAGFITLILAAGFALDRLAGIILTVLEKFA